MLDKNSNAVSDAAPKRVRKSRLARAAPAPAVINEPNADWVPLVVAPFHYGPSGYIRTKEEWHQYLHAELEKLLKHLRDMFLLDGLPADLVQEANDALEQEWSLELELPPREEARTVAIRAMGLTSLLFYTGEVTIERGEVEIVSCYVSEVREHKNWRKLPTALEKAAWWHRTMPVFLMGSVQSNFGTAIISGAAHIMARKDTVLAPFERVTWDQWQYFRLDKERPEKEKEKEYARSDWHDPRRIISISVFDPPSTATGPAGEKLFAIHIAPGVAAESGDRSGPHEDEEKYRQWLYAKATIPNQSTLRRPALLKIARSKFPRLSQRALDRGIREIKRVTGNSKWLPVGRPKSPR